MSEDPYQEYVHGFSEDEAKGQGPTDRKEVIHESILTCFSTPQGAITLAWLYDRVRMGKSTFVPGQPDLSAYQEGRRSVLLEIMGQMNLDDEELFRRARGVSRRLEKS